MKRILIITVVFTIFLLISWTFFIHMIMLQLMSFIFFLKFFGLNTLFDRHFVVQFEFFFHFSKRVITRMAIELFEFLSNEVRHSFYSLLSILNHSMVHLLHKSFFCIFPCISSSSQTKTFRIITFSIRWRVIWNLKVNIFCYLLHKRCPFEWSYWIFFYLVVNGFCLLVIINYNSIILIILNTQIIAFFQTTCIFVIKFYYRSFRFNTILKRE